MIQPWKCVVGDTVSVYLNKKDKTRNKKYVGKVVKREEGQVTVFIPPTSTFSTMPVTVHVSLIISILKPVLTLGRAKKQLVQKFELKPKSRRTVKKEVVTSTVGETSFTYKKKK